MELETTQFCRDFVGGFVIRGGKVLHFKDLINDVLPLFTTLKKC